jgi:hypothetical protein
MDREVQNGGTSVKREEGAWRPSASSNDENTEETRDMVVQNRLLTIHEVANQLEISQGSVCEIIHNGLTFHKVCAQWDSKQLTESHKQKRLDNCKRLLDRCGNEGDPFLERIVTRGETWIQRHEPESKCQSMKWKRSHSSPRKTQPAAGKIMLTVFWDSQGLLLEHFKRRFQQ